MSAEELRQSVFSSIHMSTMVKSAQASVAYPNCTFCGGGAMCTTKSSPKRKVVLCQLSLYTNPSESFVVWYKKQDEPKGMLWSRSFCPRRGQDASIELISRGCRGRCSYTLKFPNPRSSEEWYKLLRQESRKTPCVGDELKLSEDEEHKSASLDSLLTEMSPPFVYIYSEEDNNDVNSEAADMLEPLTPVSPSSSKTSKSKRRKVKSSPILCNPLNGFGRTLKRNTIQVSTSVSSVVALDSIGNTPDDISRWSWPLKA